jgi:hypothetical protein
MFALGMEPTVFTTVGPEQIKQHDSVFKYDVTGTDNRDYVQYQIMMMDKEQLWSVLDCIGQIIMTGYETPQKALQALEAHLNRTYGFIATTTNQITQ